MGEFMCTTETGVPVWVLASVACAAAICWVGILWEL
jgi:hypothetical protein